MMDKAAIRRQAQLTLAKRDFFYYCQLMAGDFYKSERIYLKQLCDSFQNFMSDDEHNVLIINIGPRHGKSRTAGMFVQWLLGNDNTKKIMTGSYNDTLSTVFSKSVRNAIQEEKADDSITVFSDIFPDTKIKRGDGAMNLWSLEKGYNNYLATSPGGTATGFGADVIIIDDLIKSALEANNANILEGHWEWFTNTMLSRLEEGGKLIIIMTRWHSEDLAGKALSKLPESGYSVKHISMRTYDEETDTMLCEDVLSKESYFRKVKAMGADIASANYQQEPIDIKGRLYSDFKTYVDRPIFKRISAYTDTADTGKDYLASYIYGETMDKEAYILDILFTKEPMEVTEPLLARKLVENEVNLCWIESNNGGRGFARNVERLMREKHGTNQTMVKWFHQSKNKQARILTNATWLMEHVYFPDGWRNRWPELYKSLMTYQREGKNSHDDAQDALTGIAEKITANSSWLV
ncbi:TPA: phage terminase large subunit [Streptococcus pneumoniae]|uniref:phage terminase large subunit n=1 Tax=Streptococcus pneumoniae TaxID=1313 RepID=UPI002A91FAC4|nr:phage terminase large subunit [Streptococcus pneumoniae]MDY6753383.1 phage terminase large subunit [Streptococcus pneumoniae]HEU3565730.1 phage terminase large subunit [Streptococcus pneumoniae]HEU3914736.1 phage terminase large subunit [Streptococcus pneumoniae]HEU3916881.1 phage terminase large subunit [Streptococcus pneumoniae]HEU8055908.1 phage terminase large subunit [Streptococcus pneumoniae]